MRKIIALTLVVATLLSGCTKTQTMIAERRAADDIVSSDCTITQQMLDDAWKEALAIGKGNPSWPIPVDLARVVYVPSTLQLGPFVFYGITVSELMVINGKVEFVETIEIHLPKNLQCRLGQVLRHELLHTVATRRILADKTFREDMKKYENEEAWVRTIYPVDMALCD